MAITIKLRRTRKNLNSINEVPKEGEAVYSFYNNQLVIGDGETAVRNLPRLYAQTWQGNIIATTYGGTGNNSGYIRAGLAEGTTAGSQSTAEGNNNTVTGSASHAEGSSNTVSSNNAHVEGVLNTASGSATHAEGLGNIANHKSQHVFGEYNIADESSADSTARGNFVEIVGNGTGTNTRSNARTLDWNGNETLAGKLTIGTDPVNNMDVATKRYVDNVDSRIPSSTNVLPVGSGGTGQNQFNTTNAIVTTGANSATGAFGWINSIQGALYSTGANVKPVFGILPIDYGGTGGILNSSNESEYGVYQNSVIVGSSTLKSGTTQSTEHLASIQSQSGALYSTGTNVKLRFGTLPVAQGGTGATTAASARSNLGAMGAKVVSGNSYDGLANISGSDTAWIRTTQNGLLPYAAGQSSLGGSLWHFNSAYIDTVNGNLNGNATTATKATKANISSTANAIAYYTDTTGTFGSKASANGAVYATAANGSIQWGTLPIAQGGTGLTASPSMLVNLGSTTAANVLVASPRPGVTGVLPVANGGTGVSSFANAAASTSAYGFTKLSSTASSTVENLAATPKGVNTAVTNAINALDYTNANGAVNKTPTNITQTDGKIAVTYSNIGSLNTSVLTAGTLGVARGGTGAASFSTNQLVLSGSSSTNALTTLPGGSELDVLIGNGVNGVPKWGNLTTNFLTSSDLDNTYVWDILTKNTSSSRYIKINYDTAWRTLSTSYTWASVYTTATPASSGTTITLSGLVSSTAVPTAGSSIDVSGGGYLFFSTAKQTGNASGTNSVIFWMSSGTGTTVRISNNKVTFYASTISIATYSTFTSETVTGSSSAFTQSKTSSQVILKRGTLRQILIGGRAGFYAGNNTQTMNLTFTSWLPRSLLISGYGGEGSGAGPVSVLIDCHNILGNTNFNPVVVAGATSIDPAYKYVTPSWILSGTTITGITLSFTTNGIKLLNNSQYVYQYSALS